MKENCVYRAKISCTTFCGRASLRRSNVNLRVRCRTFPALRSEKVSKSAASQHFSSSTAGFAAMPSGICFCHNCRLLHVICGFGSRSCVPCQKAKNGNMVELNKITTLKLCHVDFEAEFLIHDGARLFSNLLRLMPG